MSNLIYSICELIVIGFCLLTFFPVFRSWRDTKNRMYLAVLALTLGLLSYSISVLFTYLLNIDTNVFLIGGLRFGYILGYILATIQFEFMLYLRRLVKFYPLPFIIAFYLMLGNILVINSVPFIVYLTFIGFVPAYILLKDGKRKHNGLAFGMGLLFLLWGIGQIFPITLVVELFRTVAVFMFFIGTRGFYEKYIFPPKEAEEKIMGTWISKIVVKE
jgi:hypothetical protein